MEAEQPNERKLLLEGDPFWFSTSLLLARQRVGKPRYIGILGEIQESCTSFVIDEPPQILSYWHKPATTGNHPQYRWKAFPQTLLKGFGNTLLGCSWSIHTPLLFGNLPQGSCWFPAKDNQNTVASNNTNPYASCECSSLNPRLQLGSRQAADGVGDEAQTAQCRTRAPVADEVGHLKSPKEPNGATKSYDV